MSESITVIVPAEASYRVLAPELAGKYMELVGGSAIDAKAVADELSRALGDMATVTGSDAHIDLTFRTDAGGVEITLRCGDRSAVVKQPLPARKT